MPSTRATALALTVAALAASGCGGSKPAGTTQTGSPTQAASAAQTQPPGNEHASTQTLTRAELIVKANAICARIYSNLKANSTLHRWPTAALVAAHDAAYQRTANAELGKLIPPPSLAGDWEQIVAGAQTLTEDTARLGEYIRSKQVAAGRALLSTSGELRQRVLAIATRDGFSDCSLAI